MRTIGTRIETPTATIELVGPRLVEQRFHRDADFNGREFERNRKARWRITQREAHALLIVLDAGSPVHPPAMNDDHFRADSEVRMILALAIVAPGVALNTATKFYFRYHAQAFEARVFEEVEEARAWLIGMLERT